MRTILEKAIEVAIKQSARTRMLEKDYEIFQKNIRISKHIKTGDGDKTVFDLISDQAIYIADLATKGGFSHASDEVENLKDKAIANIKKTLGW